MISWGDLQGAEKLENANSDATDKIKRICVGHFKSLGVSDDSAKGRSFWERQVLRIYAALSWREKSS